MYNVTQEAWISSSHQVLGRDGSPEPLHGHNWRVRVTVEASELDARGMVIDLDLLRREVEQVLDRFDHTHLNDLPVFGGGSKVAQSATGERVAQLVCRELASRLDTDHHQVAEVRVWMTDDRAAGYRR